MSDNINKPIKNLIFPDEASTIISSILEKYGLKETNEELFEKWKKEEKGNGEILVDLIFEKLEKEFSLADFIVLIGKKFNVSLEIAEKIATDVEKNILNFVKQEPETIVPETISPKERPEKPTQEPEKPKRQDAYREAI